MAIWTLSEQASGCHHFFVNFDVLNGCISVKTSLINTKLGDFVNLGVLFLIVGSIVANPIIYRLVPSPSQFENSRQLAGNRQVFPQIIKMENSTNNTILRQRERMWQCQQCRMINLNWSEEFHLMF